MVLEQFGTVSQDPSLRFFPLNCPTQLSMKQHVVAIVVSFVCQILGVIIFLELLKELLKERLLEGTASPEKPNMTMEQQPQFWVDGFRINKNWWFSSQPCFFFRDYWQNVWPQQGGSASIEFGILTVSAKHLWKFSAEVWATWFTLTRLEKLETLRCFWESRRGFATSGKTPDWTSYQKGLGIVLPLNRTVSGWCFFKIFVMFIPTWGDDSIWLIFFEQGWNQQLQVGFLEDFFKGFNM